MHDDTTPMFRSLLVGKVRDFRPIPELQATYRGARPFPHVLLPDLFAPSLLEDLLSEMAEMSRDKWKEVDNDSRERTMRMKSAAEMGPAGERLLSIVHSAAFLYFLSEVTGIPQLLPDPYLLGSGYARMRRGDYFSVHSDRNVAYDTGMLRRLAMIVFLNKDWRSDYEGKLELWSDDATRCDATVEPTFNNTVLFEVANPNYHGVPVPLACPSERSRQSFIVYYHTVSAAGEAQVKPHTSLFAPRTHGTNRMTWRQLVREVTPPFLLKTLRRIRRGEGG